MLTAAKRFAGRVGWMKVGLEAFVAEGPSLVADVAAVAGGAKIFLDLKFHDIPATVAGAVASAAWSGASMVNVHASGGRAMLEAARQAAERAGLKRLIAVTLLTSIDVPALAELPMAGEPEGSRPPARAAREGLRARRRGVPGRGSRRDPGSVRARLLHGRPGHPAGGGRRAGPEAHRHARLRDRAPGRTSS